MIAFLVAVRNDQGQLLVLERRAPVALGSVPVFPGGQIEGANLIRAITHRVLVDTGLSIGGLHLSSADKSVQRYYAHLEAGKLVDFPKPTQEGDLHVSASWMAPSLILHLADASREMKELCRELSWIQGQRR